MVAYSDYIFEILNPPATSPRVIAHIDHAIQAVARALIPPTPLPCCSLAPSVTTPLYSSIVS